jgi:hypothetical protein
MQPSQRCIVSLFLAEDLPQLRLQEGLNFKGISLRIFEEKGLYEIPV